MKYKLRSKRIEAYVLDTPTERLKLRGNDTITIRCEDSFVPLIATIYTETFLGLSRAYRSYELVGVSGVYYTLKPVRDSDYLQGIITKSVMLILLGTLIFLVGLHGWSWLFILTLVLYLILLVNTALHIASVLSAPLQVKEN